MSLQSFLLGVIEFINATFLPFLFAVALAIFVYNIVKYFIIDATNKLDKEKARRYAIYSILAFVLMVSIWGIVNLVAGGIGLDREEVICPDYFPVGFCRRNPNVEVPPIPDVDSGYVPISPPDSDYESPYTTTPEEPEEPILLPPCGPGDDPFSNNCDPNATPEEPDEEPEPSGTEIPNDTIIELISQRGSAELYSRLRDCNLDGDVLVIEHGDTIETTACVSNEEAVSRARIHDEDYAFEILPLGGVFVTESDLEGDFPAFEIDKVIGYLEYNIEDGILDCQSIGTCYEILENQCTEQGGLASFDRIPGGINVICATELPGQ